MNLHKQFRFAVCVGTVWLFSLLFSAAGFAQQDD